MTAPPTLGILMLDTRFPRPLGDGGNPASYPFPVRIRRVPGASAARAVRGDPMALADLFAGEARALADEGCAAITTTCGFLAPLQHALSDAVPVPVLVSALLGVRPLAEAGRHVGILTIAASSLTPAHLAAADVPHATPIGTLEGGSFAASILGDEATLDTDAARAEHVTAANALCRAHPALTDIVLECANMPPYAAAIEAATGRHVHTIVDMASAMLRRAAYPPSPSAALIR